MLFRNPAKSRGSPGRLPLCLVGLFYRGLAVARYQRTSAPVFADAGFAAHNGEYRVTEDSAAVVTRWRAGRWLLVTASGAVML